MYNKYQKYLIIFTHKKTITTHSVLLYVSITNMLGIHFRGEAKARSEEILTHRDLGMVGPYACNKSRNHLAPNGAIS